MENDTLLIIAKERIADSGILPGQRYRHHATDYVYVITAIGIYEPDLEPQVIYRVSVDDILWIRPLDMFFGFVQKDGTLVPRFTRVD